MFACIAMMNHNSVSSLLHPSDKKWRFRAQYYMSESNGLFLSLYNCVVFPNTRQTDLWKIVLKVKINWDAKLMLQNLTCEWKLDVNCIINFLWDVNEYNTSTCNKVNVNAFMNGTGNISDWYFTSVTQFCGEKLFYGERLLKRCWKCI